MSMAAPVQTSSTAIASSTACRLCGAGDFVHLAAVGGSPVVRCRTCGLVAVQRRPSADRDYYAQMDHEAFAAYYGPIRIREAKPILDYLKQRGVTGSLLDVGCSYGWFLREAAAAGFTVTGLEPSQALARVAQTAAVEARLLIGGIDAVPELAERFNVITLLDVLEHLDDPRRALESLHTRLAPGGVLVIRVPQVAGLIHRAAFALARVSRGRIATPLEALAQIENESPHVFFFSQRTLTRLLCETGFRVLHQQECDVIDAAQLRSRARASSRRDVYARWDNPLVRVGLSLLQTLGRWTGLRDERTFYATSL